MEDRVPQLTKRELQILEYMALGHSAKEAAKHCGITPRTVETHLDTMRLKLRARNRVHMVAIALGTGLLPRKFQSDFGDIHKRAG